MDWLILFIIGAVVAIVVAYLIIAYWPIALALLVAGVLAHDIAPMFRK